MGNKPVINKQQILDTAFELASTRGLSGLSVREVARACGISVGTMYNSYPTKGELVNDVVGRFWSEALSEHMRDATSGGDFIEFCRDLATQLDHTLKRFQNDWLSEIAALDTHDLVSAREREESCFVHVRRGLVVALQEDTRIDRSRLTGPLAPEALCAFVWDSMLSSIKRGDDSCETLFELLKRTLY